MSQLTIAVVEKSFRTHSKFYLVPIIVIKYLPKNVLCVSKGLATSEAYTQIEII